MTEIQFTVKGEKKGVLTVYSFLLKIILKNSRECLPKILIVIVPGCRDANCFYL